MISILLEILKVFIDFVSYIAAGVVTVLNLFFDGVSVAINAALAVLPEVPIGETKLAGGLLEEMNWFFPFGGVAAVLSSMLVVYLIWMGVRIFLRMVRAV